MNAKLLSAIIGVSLAIGAVAGAQAQTRIRGTIADVNGDVIAVKTADGKTADVQLGEKTNIVYAQPIAMADIKSGDFLGVTSVKAKDGALIAYDLRRFPKPTNPGHRPFDGGENQTMTNATVSATVDATKGRELVLSYDGGSQKVTVAETAAITSLMPGQRSQIVRGSYVNLLADAGADGKLTARSVEVRKDAPEAPKGG